MCCVVMVKEGPERNTKNFTTMPRKFQKNRGPSAQRVRALIKKPDSPSQRLVKNEIARHIVYRTDRQTCQPEGRV